MLLGMSSDVNKTTFASSNYLQKPSYLVTQLFGEEEVFLPSEYKNILHHPFGSKMVALWQRSKTLGHCHHTSPPKVIYYWSYLFWWYWPDQTSLTGSTGHPIIWLLFAHLTLSTPKGTIWHFYPHGQKLKSWNTKCNAGLWQTLILEISQEYGQEYDRTWNL